MRALVPALVAGLIVLGVIGWLLFRSDGATEPLVPPGTDPSGGELAENPHLLVETGTLMVQARAANGMVPFGTEVGYEHRGRLRLHYAGEDGERRFADAPVGTVVVVARAPGYEEVRQRREILPGVVVQVALTLRPLRD